MYTMHGLELIDENPNAVISKELLENVMQYITDFQSQIEAAENFISAHLNTPSPVKNTIVVDSLVNSLNQYISSSDSNIPHEVFSESLSITKTLLENNKKLFSFIFENIDSKPKNKIDDSFFKLKPHGFAMHRLGMFDYDEEQLIYVTEEFEDFYVGKFWGSTFYGILFKKEDVRTVPSHELFRVEK